MDSSLGGVVSFSPPDGGTILAQEYNPANNRAIAAGKIQLVYLFGFKQGIFNASKVQVFYCLEKCGFFCIVI
jgi:hypothetical protein